MVDSMEQVIFPEYLQPLLRSSKYSLALFVYRSPCWDQLLNDTAYTKPQKIYIIEETFRRLAMNGLELDLNAFYMIHNIDARKKEPIIADIGLLADQILNQKVGQLDDLILKREHTNANIEIIPNIKTNGMEMTDTKEIVEDNKLLNQININTVNDFNPLEIKENTFQIKERKLLGTKSMKHFYSEDEEEEEEEEDEDFDFNLDEENISIRENGNLVLNESLNKTYKTKNIRYKDRFWNELAKTKIESYTFDVLFVNDDLDISDLECINTYYHGILANTIQNQCTKLFQNANIYEGDYYDLLIADSGINLDFLINQNNVKADIYIMDKKWKILKFKSDIKYNRLVKNLKEIKPIKWPAFNFQELNINFHGQINDV